MGLDTPLRDPRSVRRIYEQPTTSLRLTKDPSMAAAIRCRCAVWGPARGLQNRLAPQYSSTVRGSGVDFVKITLKGRPFCSSFVRACSKSNGTELELQRFTITTPLYYVNAGAQRQRLFAARHGKHVSRDALFFGNSQETIGVSFEIVLEMCGSRTFWLPIWLRSSHLLRHFPWADDDYEFDLNMRSTLRLLSLLPSLPGFA